MIPASLALGVAAIAASGVACANELSAVTLTRDRDGRTSQPNMAWVENGKTAVILAEQSYYLPTVIPSSSTVDARGQSRRAESREVRIDSIRYGDDGTALVTGSFEEHMPVTVRSGASMPALAPAGSSNIVLKKFQVVVREGEAVDLGAGIDGTKYLLSVHRAKSAG